MRDLTKYFEGIRKETLIKVINILQEVLKEIKGKENVNIGSLLETKIKEAGLENDVLGMIKCNLSE